MLFDHFRPVGRSILFTALAPCWMLLLLPSFAQAQPVFKLDHFKCYQTTNTPANQGVLLQDQFDRAISPTFRESVTVWRPVRFCNPVEKTRLDTGKVTPILHPENHLKLYRMFVDDPNLAPTRKVVVENQFGRKTIRTFGQEVLAVPTQKNEEPPPVELDHFKCYRAYGGNINKLVTLRDQFGIQQNVNVAYPFGFCNPTEKIHNEVKTPIRNEEDHLVCYKISPSTFTRTLLARNQFGQETLIVRDPDLLCVPSKKRKVVVLP